MSVLTVTLIGLIEGDEDEKHEGFEGRRRRLGWTEHISGKLGKV